MSFPWTWTNCYEFEAFRVYFVGLWNLVLKGLLIRRAILRSRGRTHISSNPKVQIGLGLACWKARMMSYDTMVSDASKYCPMKAAYSIKLLLAYRLSILTAFSRMSINSSIDILLRWDQWHWKANLKGYNFCEMYKNQIRKKRLPKFVPKSKEEKKTELL